MLFCKYIEVVQALFWAVLQIWDKYVICVTRCYTSQRFCYTSQSFVTLHRVIFDCLLHFIEILLHFIELSLLDCYTSQSFVTLHRVFRPEPKLCVQVINKRRRKPKYSIFFLYGGFFIKTISGQFVLYFQSLWVFFHMRFVFVTNARVSSAISDSLVVAPRQKQKKERIPFLDGTHF